MNPLGQAEQHSLPGTRSDAQAWREKWLLLLLLVLLVVMVVAVVLQSLFQIIWNSTRATIDWEWCIASTEITCCTPLVVRTSPKQSAKPNVILIKHPFFYTFSYALGESKSCLFVERLPDLLFGWAVHCTDEPHCGSRRSQFGRCSWGKTEGDTYVCRPRGRHKQV